MLFNAVLEGFGIIVIGGQYFQGVPVQVAEIDTSSTVMTVNFHVYDRLFRSTAVGNIVCFDPFENLIELLLAYSKRIVLRSRSRVVGFRKVKGERVVDSNR